MDDRDAVKAHLVHLRLTGQSPGSVYARQRFLARLEAWLADQGDGWHDALGGWHPEPSGPGLLGASAQDLARWRAALPARLEPHTIRGYVSHARGFYRWAVDETLIAVNPAARLPVPPKTVMLPRPVPDVDLFEAHATAPPRIRPWIALAGWAGLRCCEIAYLRRDRVMDTAAQPYLLIAAGATKGRRERVVPLSGWLLGELRAAGLPRSGFVFRRLDGRAGAITPGMISHLANRHLAAWNFTMHQCRHRFLTAAQRISHDLRETQELAGHARPESTVGYLALDNAAAAGTVEAIPVPGKRLHAVSLLSDTVWIVLQYGRDAA